MTNVRHVCAVVASVAQEPPIEQLRDRAAIEVGVGSLQRFRNEEFVNRAHVNVLQSIR